MKLKKALLVTGAASTIGVASFAGVSAVSAQSSDNTAANSTGMQGLVDKIANKFNLNKDEVQAVVDQDRDEHQQQMQKRFEQRLDKAVSDGKITSAQKTLILDKLKEMQTFRDSLKGKTPEERRKLMQQKLTELQQWAKDNNIPEEYIHPFGGRGGPEGPPADADRDDSSQN